MTDPDKAPSPPTASDPDETLFVQHLSKEATRRSLIHEAIRGLHGVVHAQPFEAGQHELHKTRTHAVVAVVSMGKAMTLDPAAVSSVFLSLVKIAAQDPHHDAAHGHDHGHGQGHGPGHEQDQGHGHGHGHAGRRGRKLLRSSHPSHGVEFDGEPHRWEGPYPLDGSGIVLTAPPGGAPSGAEPDHGQHRASLDRDAAPIPVFTPDPAAPRPAAPEAPTAGSGPITGLDAEGSVRMQKMHGKPGGLIARMAEGFRSVLGSRPVREVAKLAHKALHNPIATPAIAAFYGYMACYTGSHLPVDSLVSGEGAIALLKTGVYSVIALGAAHATLEIYSDKALKFADRLHEQRLARMREKLVAADREEHLDVLLPAEARGAVRWEKDADGVLRQRMQMGRTEPAAPQDGGTAPEVTVTPAAAPPVAASSPRRP